MQPILPPLTKKLSIPLKSPIKTHNHDPDAIDREERADGVEFRGEDFEHDERKGELTEGGADICAFESTLRGADFNEFLRSKDDRTSAMSAEVERILGMRLEHGGAL